MTLLLLAPTSTAWYGICWVISLEDGSSTCSCWVMSC